MKVNVWEQLTAPILRSSLCWRYKFHVDYLYVKHIEVLKMVDGGTHDTW